MPKPRLLPPTEPPVLASSFPHSSAPLTTSSAANRSCAAWERIRWLRAALPTLMATAAGMLLMRVLIPLLPYATITDLFAAHISPLRAGEVAPLLVWLRLLWRRLPTLLLLAAAGLTRFSGALTTALLTLRGLSDGAAGYCLYRLFMGAATPPVDQPLPDPRVWLVIFVALTAIEATLRTVMTAEARRLAATLSPLPGTAAAASPLTPAVVRTRLWRYAAVTLAVISGLMLAEGLYVILLSAAIRAI